MSRHHHCIESHSRSYGAEATVVPGSDDSRIGARWRLSRHKNVRVHPVVRPNTRPYLRRHIGARNSTDRREMGIPKKTACPSAPGDYAGRPICGCPNSPSRFVSSARATVGLGRLPLSPRGQFSHSDNFDFPFHPRIARHGSPKWSAVLIN